MFFSVLAYSVRNLFLELFAKTACETRTKQALRLGNCPRLTHATAQRFSRSEQERLTRGAGLSYGFHSPPSSPAA